MYRTTRPLLILSEGVSKEVGALVGPHEVPQALLARLLEDGAIVKATPKRNGMSDTQTSSSNTRRRTRKKAS